MIPDGGEKDTEPPVLTKASPPNKSTNLYPQKINLIFNENIQLKNLNDQVSITPELKTKPVLNAYRNKISITLNKDSLLPNTTYSINFGQSIADIHEDNILPNFNYSFSTGPFLDTCSLSGLMQTLKEKKVLEKGLVVLKNTTNGLIYRTFTNKEGLWNFNNLAQANYELIIYLDLNKNKRLDATEYYYKKDIAVTPGSDFLKCNAITYKSVIQDSVIKVLKATYINDYCLGIKTNTPISKPSDAKYDLSDASQKKNKPLIPTEENDSFLLYHSFIDTDTIKLNIFLQSQQIFYIKQPKSRKIEAFKLQAKQDLFRRSDKAYIISNIPISLVNSNKIKSLKGDSIRCSMDTNNPYTLEISHQSLEKLTIFFEKGAITDLNGNSNEGDTVLIRLASDEQTGSSEFSIIDSLSSDTSPLFIKVYNKNQSYYFRSRLNKVNQLKGFLPGNYSIEAWIDENRNGIWDEGNYFLNQNPERIMIRPDVILIKPNWDLNGVEIYME